MAASHRIVRLSIALLVAGVLLMISPGIALGAFWTEQQDITPLTTGGNEEGPYVRDGRIAYVTGSAVHVYDLVRGVDRALPRTASVGTRPALDGDKVVYRSGDWVYVYDLAEATETTMNPAPATGGSPSIDGDRAVYADNRTGDQNVYLYNIGTGEEKTIASDVADQDSPDVSGNLVVFRDRHLDEGDIVAHNVDTGVQTRLTTGGEQKEPAIDDRMVAWTDTTSDLGDIWLRDMAGGTVMQLTVGGGEQHAADVAGGIVVYQQGPDSSSDVRLYDTVSERDMLLTGAAPLFQQHPSTDGRTVVYQGDSGTGRDIYMMELLVPRLTLVTERVVPYGIPQRAFWGWLESGTGLPMSRNVRLQVSPDGDQWSDCGSGGSNADGSYMIGENGASYPDKVWYRSVFDGDEFHFGATSPVVAVTPQVSLAAPSTERTLYRRRTYSFYGSVKPGHDAGERHVKVLGYRNESGRWILRKTVLTTYLDYEWYSKYSCRFSISGTGRWRFRAYSPTDEWHAATYSGWTYRTIK